MVFSSLNLHDVETGTTNKLDIDVHADRVDIETTADPNDLTQKLPIVFNAKVKLVDSVVGDTEDLAQKLLDLTTAVNTVPDQTAVVQLQNDVLTLTSSVTTLQTQVQTLQDSFTSLTSSD